MISDSRAGFAQRDYFSVSRGIMVHDIAVVTASNDLAFANHNGPDRNFSCLERTLRLTQSLLHPEFIRFTRSFGPVSRRCHKPIVDGTSHGSVVLFLK